MNHSLLSCAEKTYEEQLVSSSTGDSDSYITTSILHQCLSVKLLHFVLNVYII